MPLSKELVEELRQILSSEGGKPLNSEEASAIAEGLIRYFTALNKTCCATQDKDVL